MKEIPAGMPKMLILVFVIVLCVGCVSPFHQDTQVEPTFDLSTIPKYTPTATNTAEPTSTNSTHRVTTQTATPTTTNMAVNFNCLKIEEKISNNKDIRWSLVLAGGNDDPSYILYLHNLERVNLPENTNSFSTSPDGNWLAYLEYADATSLQSWLVLKNNKTGEQKKIRKEEGWDLLITWLNNEEFVFNKRNENEYVPSVVNINSKSTEQKIIEPDYPGIKPFAGAGGASLHFIYSSVLYNTTLDYAIIPQVTEKGEWFINLWDIDSKRTIASLEDKGYFSHNPVWLPDGLRAVVAITKNVDPTTYSFNDELFIISASGDVQQLTSFETNLKNNSIGTASASPDGRYLAFWLNIKPSTLEGERLAVINLETKEIVNYCVPGSRNKSADRPVWSPDSRYLAVSDHIGNSDEVQAIIVDTKENWAAIVGKSVRPMGWLE